MRCLTFAKRCGKEILRDPLNLAFGLGFPVVLLLLLSMIQRNIPVPLFAIESLAPGITVFGLSFLTLFAATLVAKDRESALLLRLYTSPMRGRDFLLGYLLPLLPIALGQVAVCFLVALPLGLPFTSGILWAILGALPIAVCNVSLGLLFGSLLGVKQVGGLVGSLFTNLSAWLSGIWFDPKLVGGAFEGIANALPFLHAVEWERALYSGNLEGAWMHLGIVSLYALGATALAAVFFLRQMKKQ